MNFDSIPFLVVFVGIIGVTTSLGSAFFNRKEIFMKGIPTISKAMGKFPQDIIFAFTLNFVAYFFLHLMLKKFKSQRRKIPLIFNIFLLGISFIVSISLSLFSLISFYDSKILHYIIASFFLNFFLVLIIVWILQDTFLCIKRRKRKEFKEKDFVLKQALNIVRGLMFCIGLIINIGMFVSVMLLEFSDIQDTKKTIIENFLALFEYFYLFNFYLFILFMQNIKKRKKKEKDPTVRYERIEHYLRTNAKNESFI